MAGPPIPFDAEIPLNIRIGQNKAGRDIIQFFDRRFDHTPCGQFISSYYLEDFLKAPNNGITLDTGAPEWRINGSEHRKLCSLATINARSSPTS